MSRIQSGNGSLGMLATDSTLYRETTRTVIQFGSSGRHPAHPQKPQNLRVLMSKRRADSSSAGGIVFRRVPARAPRYLLIRDSYNNWGFPRGISRQRVPAEAPCGRSRGDRVARWCFRVRSE